MRRIGREVTEGGGEREQEMGKSLHNSKLLSATHRGAKGIKISAPPHPPVNARVCNESRSSRFVRSLFCVCMCVSSLIFMGLGFIFPYGRGGWWRGSPILIKSRPIRVSSWLKALESVTLLFNPETQRSRRQAAERHGVTIKIQIAAVPAAQWTDAFMKRWMWRSLLDLMPLQGHLLWSHLGLYITINYK